MLDRIREIKGDYGRKTLALAVISAVITLGFAAFNLYTAVIGGALWYYALAAYYLVLLLYRMGVLTAVAVCRKRCGSDGERYDGAKRRIGLFGGVVLLLLEIAMAVVVTITTIPSRRGNGHNPGNHHRHLHVLQADHGDYKRGQGKAAS